VTGADVTAGAAVGAPLPPGSTIGILGGGQLGRMLALAAARLGFHAHVFCPDDDRPAADVAWAATVAAYDDEAALAAFAGAVDVVTYEFENVPVAAARFLAGSVPVRPSADVLATAQDRFLEKSFLRDAGIATAPFVAVPERAGLSAALAGIGVPAMLKTRRFGYDGKGQARIADPGDADAAWAAIAGEPAILEAFIGFACELSIIAARGLDGRIACYEVVRNVHERHILARSVVPAGIPEATAAAAREIGERVLTALDYVGVMGVEMFLCGDSRLLVNEIAPRVHNTGHWTIDACTISQFEQHVRAICGWPLGPVTRHADAVMVNLLGDAVDRWPELAGAPDAALHIYGKKLSRPGRKMGHVTRLFPLGTGPGAAER
jgi:5-(carboxyamino)imidazole ribonucleotide synthase